MIKKLFAHTFVQQIAHGGYNLHGNAVVNKDIYTFVWVKRNPFLNKNGLISQLKWTFYMRCMPLSRAEIYQGTFAKQKWS